MAKNISLESGYQFRFETLLYKCVLRQNPVFIKGRGVRAFAL
jgi:hypothetical protein